MQKCKITLKPYGKDRQISYMDVKFEFDQLKRNTGEELCNICLEAHKVPQCKVEHVLIEDELGMVEFSIEETKPYPYHLKHFYVKRPLQGNVKVSYVAYPRIIGPKDRCAPYIDFRCEDGGANATGSAFLADFKDYEGLIQVYWEMSQMPKGSKGVCGYGEGDFERNLKLEKLRYCYYAMGDVKSITEGEFGFYWLTEPDFDMEAMATYTKDLFVIMQQFFKDTEPNYRIFARKDPFTHSGGSAANRSYMFGWNDTEPVSLKEKQNILAHEMVHNWPHLNDEPFGITSWYSEGAAEYYSIVIPLRAGLITKEEALYEIQTRTDDYYTNSTRHMENIAAAQICWEDRRAQKIPYGRGVFFLANVDVWIRHATDNKKNLDDVVLAILEKDRAGETLGNEVFLRVVKEISGLDLTGEWENMRNGVPFAPEKVSFEGFFTNQEIQVQEKDTGRTVLSYQWNIR